MSISESPQSDASLTGDPSKEAVITYDLDPRQEEMLTKTFQLLLKKGSKKRNELDEREAPVLLRSLGFNPSIELTQQIIDKAKSRQSNKVTNGFLDFAYFSDAFAEIYTLQPDAFRRHTEKEILEAFRVITPDNKDFLEPQQLKRLLMDTDHGFTIEEVDNMVRTFKDKDTGLLWHDDIADVLALDGLYKIIPHKDDGNAKK